jgi:carboxyl-terminal processing protease
MRVPESFIRPRARARIGRGNSPLLLSSALLLALGFVLGQVATSYADEPRLRGDLPPVASTVPQAEFEALSVAEARALFEEIHRLLSERVEGEGAQARALYLGAIQGMLAQVNAEQRAATNRRSAALPAPGKLLSAQQAQRIRQALGGTVTGIGIEFQLQAARGLLVISRVLPGSPAQGAGLLAQDQILAIDGRGFSGASLEEVLALLQGEGGSSVSFEFLRAGAGGPGRYILSLTRGDFSVESSEAHLETGGIGYLRLHQLHQQSTDEAEARLAELAEQGAERFILDLRGCVGGDIEAARALADLFLARGTIIAHIDEPGIGSEDLRATKPQLFSQHLAILIDGWTRGAAELLAASLQEQNRAFVIGEPSMGRTRGETLIELGHSLVLRIESVEISGPMGSSWSQTGVQPDQPIWSTSQRASAPLRSAGDLQFQTALHYLANEILDRPP